MARKPKPVENLGLEQNFTELTLLRDESLFKEFLATERLTGRPVRLVLVAQEVVKKKSPEEIQSFLASTGRLSSLPNVTPLLRAEVLGEQGLLLAYEITGKPPVEYFSDPELRTFDRSSAFLIRIAALLIRLAELGILHGEVSNENVVIELSGEPSVRGAGFRTFATLSSDMSPLPSDSCPPELLISGKLSGSTDAYGLGSLAYIAFSGHRWTDAYSNLVDAVMSQEPARISNGDLPDGAWSLTKRLLEKDETKRLTNFTEVALLLNGLRNEMGLSPITTGIPDVDRVRVESAAPASTWEVDSPPNDGVLTLTNSFDEPGELVEGARDVDERALTIREIASGRRPKVVTVHRSKNVAAESHVKERADLDSRERSRAAVEEWRPETMSDAWTVPVEDIAAIVICANGHRVSMGSLFCNFCGVHLEAEHPSVIEETTRCSNGHDVSETAVFCGICGVPVAERRASAEPLTAPETGEITSSHRTDESVLCIAGHANRSGVISCVICGSRIIATPVSPTPTPTPTPTPVVAEPVRVPETVAPLYSTYEPPVMEELDTAVCPAGHPNTSTATFCRECGLAMAVVKPAAVSEPVVLSDDFEADLVFCSQEHPNRAFARFCRWCAEPLSAVTTPSQRPEVAPVVLPTATSSLSEGMPGRPFLASASASPSTNDVSVIFDQAHVAPAREEGTVIRALSRRQEEVIVQRRAVIEDVHHANKVDVPEDSPPENKGP